MRVELNRELGFEAVHRLPRVAPDHPCARMHGHSFRFEVVLSGEIDPDMGRLIDFAHISSVVEPLVRGELDHRTLNDVPGSRIPRLRCCAPGFGSASPPTSGPFRDHRARNLHGALYLSRKLAGASRRGRYHGRS